MSKQINAINRTVVFPENFDYEIKESGHTAKEQYSSPIDVTNKTKWIGVHLAGKNTIANPYLLVGYKISTTAGVLISTGTLSFLNMATGCLDVNHWVDSDTFMIDPYPQVAMPANYKIQFCIPSVAVFTGSINMTVYYKGAR